MNPRTRTSGSVTRATGSRVLSHYDGTVLTYPVTTGPYTGAAKVMHDFSTPGFRKLQSGGAIIASPADFVSRVYTFGGNQGYSINSTQTGGPGDRVISENYQKFAQTAAGPIGDPVLPDVSNLVNTHVTKAWAGVAQSDVQAGPFIMELKQTLDMLRHPLKEIGNLTHVFVNKAGKRRSLPQKVAASQSVRAVSSEYLKWRYGVIPLMLDVEGTLKALRRKQENRYSSRSSGTLNVNTTSTYDAPNLDGRFTWSITDSCVGSATVRANVLYKWEHSIDTLLGMGVSTVPSTAWEVLPYSFVVDWFLNVGEIISALEPKSGLTILTDSKVISFDLTRKRSFVNFAIASGQPWTVGTPIDGWDQVHFESWARTMMPVSEVAISYNLNISTTHLKDAIALIIQKLPLR